MVYIFNDYYFVNIQIISLGYCGQLTQILNRNILVVVHICFTIKPSSILWFVCIFVDSTLKPKFTILHAKVLEMVVMSLDFHFFLYILWSVTGYFSWKCLTFCPKSRFRCIFVGRQKNDYFQYIVSSAHHAGVTYRNQKINHFMYQFYHLQVKRLIGLKIVFWHITAKKSINRIMLFRSFDW